MSSASIQRLSTRAYFERGDGIRTSHLAGPREGSTQALVGTTEFPPGTRIDLHTHNCEETVFLLEGEAEFEADGVLQRLTAGELTWTPAHVPHRFANVGSGTMRILWIYGSVSASRTNLATGRTTVIAEEADASSTT